MLIESSPISLYLDPRDNKVKVSQCFLCPDNNIVLNDLLCELHKLCPLATVHNTKILLNMDKNIEIVYRSDATELDLITHGQHLPTHTKEYYLKLIIDNKLSNIFDNLTTDQWKKYFESVYRW